jgi:hypothetical protein
LRRAEPLVDKVDERILEALPSGQGRAEFIDALQTIATVLATHPK